ncbi:MAG: hypothetical protein PHH01_02495 [Patescibacteria group bacterium]|nr:hypothetical protein [Patescibacteria group bacterium]
MFITVHASYGIFISQAVKSPILVFLLSLFSHYLLDIIPHGDRDLSEWIGKKPVRLFKIEAIDLTILAVYLGILFWQGSEFNVLLLVISIIGAALPDILSEIRHQSINSLATFYRQFRLLDRIRLIKGFLNWQNRVHDKLHWLIKTNMGWVGGILIQVIFILIFFFLATSII